MSYTHARTLADIVAGTRIAGRIPAAILTALFTIQIFGCGGSSGTPNYPRNALLLCSVPTLTALADCEAPALEPGNFARCNFVDANLSTQKLNCLVFQFANFAGADLSSTDLSYSVLTGANFANANLTNANLTGANLAGANLAGADLTGAILDGANLPQ